MLHSAQSHLTESATFPHMGRLAGLGITEVERPAELGITEVERPAVPGLAEGERLEEPELIKSDLVPLKAPVSD